MREFAERRSCTPANEELLPGTFGQRLRHECVTPAGPSGPRVEARRASQYARGPRLLDSVACLGGAISYPAEFDFDHTRSVARIIEVQWR